MKIKDMERKKRQMKLLNKNNLELVKDSKSMSFSKLHNSKDITQDSYEKYVITTTNSVEEYYKENKSDFLLYRDNSTKNIQNAKKTINPPILKVFNNIKYKDRKKKQ